MSRARVTGLWIYPVKSMSGIPLTEMDLVERGLRYDRRWMVVDEDGRFLTQRSVPELAVVETVIAGDRIVLSGRGRRPVWIPLEPDGEPASSVVVWGDEVAAVPGPPKVDRWLSEVLGRPVRLVHMPETSDRAAKRDPTGRGARVSFADAYPLLLISEESLGALNERLERPVPMDRFRPNVVARGAGAFDEDGWDRFRIGSIECRVASRCARCSTTTVDQVSGERGKEPLKTLATFRREGDDVFFGVNVVHAGTGTLAVGDPIETLG
ncbi:MAG: MOSC domain-containing protein [Gemmatimonadota bacterium]|nr:MOSC domain-containing protein [Gemmatimonadota bacterium]